MSLDRDDAELLRWRVERVLHDADQLWTLAMRLVSASERHQRPHAKEVRAYAAEAVEALTRCRSEIMRTFTAKPAPPKSLDPPKPRRSELWASRGLDPRRIFTANQKVEIFERAEGRCEGCGIQLIAVWHADHIVPHCLGGRTEVENGQALCVPCNMEKGCRVDVCLDDYSGCI